MNPGMKMMLVSQARERDNGTRYEEERDMPRGDARYEMPESRFRDRRGREHYDNGRYAPKGATRMNPRSAEPSQYRMSDDKDDEIESREYNRPSNVIGFARHGDSRKQSEHQIGHSQGREQFEETAKEWMKNLQNADGTRGPHWTMDQAKSLMGQVSADCEPAEYWAVLNALYSDYSQVLKKFGIDRTDVYAHMAKAWLDDEDAVDDKAAAYFEYIVEH